MDFNNLYDLAGWLVRGGFEEVDLTKKKSKNFGRKNKYQKYVFAREYVKKLTTTYAMKISIQSIKGDDVFFGIAPKNLETGILDNMYVQNVKMPENAVDMELFIESCKSYCHFLGKLDRVKGDEFQTTILHRNYKGFEPDTYLQKKYGTYLKAN